MAPAGLAALGLEFVSIDLDNFEIALGHSVGSGAAVGRHDAVSRLIADLFLEPFERVTLRRFEAASETSILIVILRPFYGRVALAAFPVFPSDQYDRFS
jgi:hypothetical protein